MVRVRVRVGARVGVRVRVRVRVTDPIFYNPPQPLTHPNPNP